MKPALWPLVGALLWLPLLGCERPNSAVSGPPAPSYAPVVSDAIARIEERLAAEAATEPPRTEPPLAAAELERRLSGLLQSALRAPGQARNYALTDLVDSPREGTQWLLQRALDPSQPEPERALALDVLQRRGSPADARALMDGAEQLRSGELRALCYWHLGRIQFDGILPRLVLRLKYEIDWSAVLWLGWALCTHGVHSGMDAVLAVSRDAPDEGLRQRARGIAEELSQSFQLASPEELLFAWHRGDPMGQLAPVPRSQSYQLELWRWLARLDEFQLRGVDDCRFLLARLDRVAAEVAALALVDHSPYVRLGAAQVLAQMGPRGSVAAANLVQGLDDPELGVWMAAALGAVGYAPARTLLEQRLSEREPLPMRVAAARALGALGLAESALALRPLLLDGRAPRELRQAAAEALVYCGEPEPAVPVLLAALTDLALEPATSAAALRHHLSRLATAKVAGAEELLQRWDQAGRREGHLAAPGAKEPPLPSPREVQVQRAEWLAAFLAQGPG